jgi:hypothetical protein
LFLYAPTWFSSVDLKPFFHCRLNGESSQTTSTSGSFRSGDLGDFGGFGFGDYGKLKTERPVPSADVLDDDLDEYMSKRKASKNDLVWFYKIVNFRYYYYQLQF